MHPFPLARTLTLALAGALLAMLAALGAAAPLAAGSSTPVEQATPRPTRSAGFRATVLADRLRVRGGPGTDYPILTRTEQGEEVAVHGQAGGCAWLRITAPDGTIGWVSADPELLDLGVPCASLPSVPVSAAARAAFSRTPTPFPTATSTPTFFPTATATNTPFAPNLAVRQGIPVPPSPTPRFRPTPTRRPGAAPTAARVQPTADPMDRLAASGPYAAGNFRPEMGYTSIVPTTFSWVSDMALGPDQVFELAFWTPGQSPEDGLGWTGATTGNSLNVKLGDHGPGTYYWGVWLGGFVNSEYRRIRYLGGGNMLTIPGPPEAPSAPPREDCPPSAPCKP
jgi:hypothetical protein